MTIIDDGKQSTIVTISDTIGQALFDAGVTLYLSDEVSPPLDSAVSGAMTIRIKRAMPIQLMVDGVVIEARTNAAVVADALVELNAPLFGLDYVIPPADAAVSEGMTIEIVRVTEEIVSESETITHERRLQPDADIALDQSAVIQPGQDGRRETRYRVRYENGAEVSRVLSETLDVEAPVPEITAYGTKVVAQGTVNTPQGSRSYWRKLCVVATYYTPPPNITATGGEIYRGVVAAKRRFIPLYTQVYVPGYGEGTVLDTGAGPSSTDLLDRPRFQQRGRSQASECCDSIHLGLLVVAAAGRYHLSAPALVAGQEAGGQLRLILRLQLSQCLRLCFDRDVSSLPPIGEGFAWQAKIIIENTPDHRRHHLRAFP